MNEAAVELCKKVILYAGISSPVTENYYWSDVRHTLSLIFPEDVIKAAEAHFKGPQDYVTTEFPLRPKYTEPK